MSSPSHKAISLPTFEMASWRMIASWFTLPVSAKKKRGVTRLTRAFKADGGTQLYIVVFVVVIYEKGHYKASRNLTQVKLSSCDPLGSMRISWLAPSRKRAPGVANG